MLVIKLIFISFSNQYKIIEGTGETFNGQWLERSQCSVSKRLLLQGGSHFLVHPSHLMKVSKFNDQKEENEIGQVIRK